MAGHAHPHEHTHEGLDVEVERTGPCRASVSFKVSPAEFKKTVERGLAGMARRSRMKGFRPGKVPSHLLRKQFGPQVEREAIEHFLNHAYESAMKEHELRAAAHPRIDVESVTASDAEGLEHTFEIYLRPEVVLGSYRGLTVEGRSLEVDDEELDATLEDLRRQHSRPEPAGEAGLPEDGMAVARLSFHQPDQDEPLLDREGIRLSPKTAPRGIDPEAYTAAMTGATEGDTRELDIVFPEDFPVEAAHGSRGTCRIEITEAFRIVAPTDEELFQVFEVEDEAGLREALRARVREAKGQQEDLRLENALLEKLIEAHPMELPEPLIEEQAQAKVAELRQALEAQEGLSAEELETRLAQEGRQARESAAKAMRAVYLMEEIAKAEEIKIAEEDLEEELLGIAGRNGVEVAEVRKYYREQGLLQQLALELLERKVRSFLRESADILPSGA